MHAYYRRYSEQYDFLIVWNNKMKNTVICASVRINYVFVFALATQFFEVECPGVRTLDVKF